MSFPTNGFTAVSETVLKYAGPNNNKKIKVTASTLLDSVAVYAVKWNQSYQGVLLRENKKNEKFSDSAGTVYAVVLLGIDQKTIDSNTLGIGFGTNVSRDPSEDSGAAGWLTIKPGEDPNLGNFTPLPPSTSMTGFGVNFQGMNAHLSDFVHQLEAPFNGQNVINIQVKQMSNNNYGLEGGLVIHVCGANGSLLGIIKDTSVPNDDVGVPSLTDIQNGAFNLNLADHPGGIFLYGLVENKSGEFAIGDPKVNAKVTITEVD